MAKKLPSVKKGLKEFILDEDAKVIDKTATRLAITATFLAINFLGNTHDANAKGHSNHSNHNNNLNAPENYGTGIHGGTNPMAANVNQIPDKSVETMHANHYNHQDQAGGQGGSMIGFVIGAVVAAAAGGAAAPAFGFVAFSIEIGLNAATFGFATAMLAGGVVGSELMSDGPISGDIIDTGNPHYVPEPILQALAEEEEN